MTLVYVVEASGTFVVSDPDVMSGLEAENRVREWLGDSERRLDLEARLAEEAP